MRDGLFSSSHLGLISLPPGFKCPICSKSVASDEMEMHFIMCLSKPRLSYNGKGPWPGCVGNMASCWLGMAPGRLERYLLQAAWAGSSAWLAKRAVLQRSGAAHCPFSAPLPQHGSNPLLFALGPFGLQRPPCVPRHGVLCPREPSWPGILPVWGQGHVSSWAAPLEGCCLPPLFSGSGVTGLSTGLQAPASLILSPDLPWESNARSLLNSAFLKARGRGCVHCSRPCPISPPCVSI